MHPVLPPPMPLLQALAFLLSPLRYMRLAACLNVVAGLLLLWALWAPQVRVLQVLGVGWGGCPCVA